MDALFTRPAFTDFGPARLGVPSQPARVYVVDGGSAGALRTRVREEGTRKPGVYGMLDRHGDLVYVGKAKCLRTRLLSYFRTKSRDPKAGRILQHTRAIAWEPSPSEFAALHRELELIQRWRPRFNVQGQPDGQRYAFVCLGRKSAPYVFLSRRPPAGCLARHGPVPAGRRAAEAVRRLNDWFRLRDCPQSQEMAFAEQGELFPIARSPGCLRLEIGNCLGPCAGACSRTAYAAQVAAARAFLAGTDLAPLEALRKQMAAASAALQFERAASLRDRLEALRWLQDQLVALRGLRREGSFVYPVKGHDGAEIWYLIRGGVAVASAAAPTDGEAGAQVRALVEAVYRTERSDARGESAEKVEGVLLVASWFRRYPEERKRALTPAEAQARCP